MIVNPQEFNYRLTIGILVVTIAVFSAFGLTTYSTLKSDKAFLEQDRKNLHNELSEIINRYDELNAEHTSLKSQLDSTIYNAGITHFALKKSEAKAAFNSTLQNQLNFLRTQNQSLEYREDSLIQVAQKIDKEKEEIIQELSIEKNKSLIEKGTLKRDLDKASIITANSFDAKAFKGNYLNKSKSSQTFKAKDAEQIQLSFVIAKNVLTPKGKKELYVQIIDPNNNVLADKGYVTFDDESLIYSHKESINYSNTALEVALTIKSDEDFKPGLYYINVFENNNRLGGTQLELN